MRKKEPIAPKMPIIGELLRSFFMERRTRKSVLARLLERQPKSIYAYEKKTDLKLGILWKLSTALEHNFFADLAAQLPAEYTQNTPLDPTKDLEIAQLKDEIRLLKAQIDVLK